MGINLRILGLAGAASALVGLAHMAACTTTDTDSPDAGGAAAVTPNAGAANGGAAGTYSGNAGSPASGTACPSPTLLAATQSGIANFDSYDGAADLSVWSFALGGDASTNVYAGPFGYGDRVVGTKTDAFETFDMVAGHDSTYALRIADSLAQNYGGGMGLWLSTCLDATTFTGVSFWVRGIAPTGKAKFSILMAETTAATPAKPDNKTGSCPGTDTTCVHPSYTFTVTDTWTEVRAAWPSFTAGDAAGTSVKPDGRNIWQLQFDIGLDWVKDGTGTYVPVPAAYELVVDTVAFY